MGRCIERTEIFNETSHSTAWVFVPTEFRSEICTARTSRAVGCPSQTIGMTSLIIQSALFILHTIKLAKKQHIPRLVPRRS
jgi:hypothetical protein